MSLADELLADLEDDSDEEELEQLKKASGSGNGSDDEGKSENLKFFRIVFNRLMFFQELKKNLKMKKWNLRRKWK